MIASRVGGAPVAQGAEPGNGGSGAGAVDGTVVSGDGEGGVSEAEGVAETDSEGVALGVSEAEAREDPDGEAAPRVADSVPQAVSTPNPPRTRARRASGGMSSAMSRTFPGAAARPRPLPG